MRLRSLLYLLIVLCALPAKAQQGLLQIDDPLHRFLERQQTLGRLPDAFLSHQPLSAYEARRYLDALAAYQDAFSPVDRRLYARFRGEAPGPGVHTFRKVIPFAFRNGRDFLAAGAEDYAIEVNPLFYLTYGQAQRTEREDRDASVPVWQNTRGVRASGRIGQHIFFETRLEENQRRDAWPIVELGTTPRLGDIKFDENGQFYDYWFVTGIVGFRSEHFEVRLGRDRNRWGFGRGSLVLSDFATTYDQLQLRTTFWRVQYTNLFTSLAYPNPGARRSFVPRRYGAFHHLGITLPGRVQLELFEAIMFASSDSTGLRDSGFDLAYLNPVIFYRAVEADRGSPDNALLGGGAAWTALPGVRLYTQLLIDELRVGEIGKGWWGNKWGWLVGADLAGLPLDNLALRLEYARLRPYLYGHKEPSSSYLHYDDLLGHPAGPNAEDVALFLAYQPAMQWRGALNVAYTRRGRNTDTQNVGADPALDTDTRVSDRDVELLQGVRQTQWLVEGHIGYEFLPDVYAELGLRAESIDDAETGRDRYVAPFVMLRWGLPFQSVRY